jgi:hypothetical protein
MSGRHMISSWSSTQGVVALSSGEAELYAMIKGAAHTLGAMSLAADFGVTMGGQVHGDSTAAIGIVNRTGVGKLRHIRVQYLWLQGKVRSGELTVKKVLGTENMADLFTKNVPEATMDKHIDSMGFEKLTDRPATAPSLAMMVGVSEASRPKWPGKKLDDQIADQLKGIEQEDWWEDTSEFMVRHHVRGRRQLFIPKHVENSPKLSQLCPLRITEGRFTDNGVKFRQVDTWSSRTSSHAPMPREWTGVTKFVLRVGFELPG